MRTLVKRSAEALICGSGLTRAARARHSPDVLVLAYHNIVPNGESAAGDTSLHLPQAAFAAQLDMLQRTHEVVSLTDAMRPERSRHPRVVITFDDAYRGAVTAGVPELACRDLPATIFVTPGFVGGGTFWWDVLAGEVGLPDHVRSHGLNRLKGKNDAIRTWAADQGLLTSDIPDHQKVASEQELTTAASDAGITLAAHTWSHASLPSLDEDELESEMVRPLVWLHERFSGVIPWISYPYGLHSPQVERAAEKAGYEGAFRVDGGWLPRRDDPTGRFVLPRLNIPAGISIRGFELRASGLLSR